MEKLQAPIGMKEGVEAGRKYEVLEAVENNGQVEYRRVGVVRAVGDMIWDNRFMSVEEGAKNASLGASVFSVVSGKGFYPGMLLREM